MTFLLSGSLGNAKLSAMTMPIARGSSPGSAVAPLRGANRRMARALASLATAFTLVLTACSEPAAQNGQRGGFAPAGPIGVVTAVANTEPLALEIEAVGNAVANESVEITSKISNTVTAVRFQEGQFVKRGTVLVNLDSSQPVAEVAVAEAALAESQSNFNRSRDLFSTQALSRSELDQIEATHKANQARLIAARARLNDTIIRAPFDGRTGFRQVSVGSLVNPGTIITTLDDTSIIKLDFNVPQTFVFALEQGLPITAQTSGLPERVFEGKVTTLGSRIDPVSRSITVRAELPNKDGVLRHGMFMTVKLRAQPVPAVLIPEQALVPEQGKMYVYVVANGVASKRGVTIGRRRPGEVEIVTGLKDRERVIIEGTQKVRDRTSVQELNQPEPAKVTSTS
jgi:membrane fusion protein, multidrug efflux system